VLDLGLQRTQIAMGTLGNAWKVGYEHEFSLKTLAQGNKTRATGQSMLTMLAGARFGHAETQIP
jgi:hypothetical protein